jgi:hypothetical protein
MASRMRPSFPREPKLSQSICPRPHGFGGYEEDQPFNQIKGGPNFCVEVVPGFQTGLVEDYFVACSDECERNLISNSLVLRGVREKELHSTNPTPPSTCHSRPTFALSGGGQICKDSLIALRSPRTYDHVGAGFLERLRQNATDAGIAPVTRATLPVSENETVDMRVPLKKYSALARSGPTQELTGPRRRGSPERVRCNQWLGIMA